MFGSAQRRNAGGGSFGSRASTSSDYVVEAVQIVNASGGKVVVVSERRLQAGQRSSISLYHRLSRSSICTNPIPSIWSTAIPSRQVE